MEKPSKTRVHVVFREASGEHFHVWADLQMPPEGAALRPYRVHSIRVVEKYPDEHVEDYHLLRGTAPRRYTLRRLSQEEAAASCRLDGETQIADVETLDGASLTGPPGGAEATR